MTEVAGPEAAARLIAQHLLGHQDEIAARSVKAVLERVPAYRDSADAELATSLKDMTSSTLSRLLESLASGETLASGEVDVIRTAAALRVRQGVPLADWIHTYRISLEAVWATVLDLVEAGVIDARLALAGAGGAIDYVNQITTYAGEAYLDAQQLEVAERERIARELLEDLLSGSEPRTPARQAAAAASGLERSSRVVVIVATPRTSTDDDAAGRAAASTLARSTGRPVAPLTVIRQGEIVLICAVGTSRPATIAESLGRAQRMIASRGLPLAIGISLPKIGYVAVADAYGEARITSSFTTEAAPVLALSDLTASSYLTLRGSRDPIALELVRPEVLEFIRADVAGDGSLIATAEAYAQADLNATVTAERLFLHVNTVHYRLRRIHEKTGIEVRHFDGLLELLTAARLLGATVQQRSGPAGGDDR